MSQQRYTLHTVNYPLCYLTTEEHLQLEVGQLTVIVVSQCHGCLVKFHPGPPQDFNGKCALPPTSTAFSNAEKSHGGLICVLFRPTYKDNKHCTGNYNNYNNLIMVMVMRMIMMRTVWTRMLCKIKYIPDTSRMTSCSYSMSVE